MSIMLKDTPLFTRPRERLKKYGVEYLTNEELLSILLRTGTKNISVKDLSLYVLKQLDNISEINNASLNSLKAITGIGEAKAMSILAALELGKRIYLKNETINKIIIKNGLSVYNLFRYLIYTEKQENLIVLLLDSKNNLIKSKTVFKGSLNISIAHPREIFKEAIINNANSIILVHNHPSGDPYPSINDKNITNQMIHSGTIIGIPVIDHIIIGNNKYYTFKENKVVIVNEKNSF